MKLVTLDWEGTLVDFQWNLKAAVEETIHLLKGLQIPEEILIGLDYATLYNLVQEEGPGWGFGDGSLLTRIDDIYDRYDLDAASRWTAAPGLHRTLSELEDFKLAVVSNIGRRGIDEILDRLALKAAFGLIVTRNDVRYLKPAPEGIITAMAWAGAGKDETMHIGDSLSDLFAARNAGVKIGVVLGGQDTPETLLREKPDLVLKKLSDLPLELAGPG